MSDVPAQFDAAAYDRWFDSAWGQYALRVESRALLRALGDIRDGLALDVGSGTGRFMEVLAQRGARVVGLDVDRSMVGISSGRGHRSLVGDGHRLPFRDACFDVSIAVTLLEFVDDPQRVVAEIMRVTRHRGRVVLALLNRASAWGIASARRRRRAPWSSARLLPARRVADWCRSYGTVRRRGALFAPAAFPGLDCLGPVLERAGRLCPARGALQLVIVERW